MKFIRAGLIGLGVLVLAYAGHGLTTIGYPDRAYVRFAVLVWLAHDALLLPAALLVGAILARWAAGWVRPVLQGALLASAVVSLIAYPFLTGVGRSADLPSALPRDYPRGLLLTLTAIWLVAGVLLTVRGLRRRAATPRTGSRP